MTDARALAEEMLRRDSYAYQYEDVHKIIHAYLASEAARKGLELTNEANIGLVAVWTKRAEKVEEERDVAVVEQGKWMKTAYAEQQRADQAEATVDRARQYLMEKSGIGAGDDPVRFLIASHNSRELSVENISKTVPKRLRDIFYRRQRYKNRVFATLVSFFSEEAERTGVSKKDIAKRLQRDPALITRWLSNPGNLTLDTISDLLFALDAEADPGPIVRFSDRRKPNYAHPLIAKIIGQELNRPDATRIKTGPVSASPSYVMQLKREAEVKLRASESLKSGYIEALQKAEAARTKLEKERDRWAQLAGGELQNAHTDLIREYKRGIEDGRTKAEAEVARLREVVNKFLKIAEEHSPNDAPLEAWHELAAVFALPSPSATTGRDEVARLREALTHALGLIVEIGNLNGFRNLSDQELGGLWQAVAKECAEALASPAGGEE